MPTALAKRIVGGWQAALAQLAHARRELDVLAGELCLAVVVREADREGLLLVLGQADQVVLEARDHPLVADDQRQPLRRGALDRLAVQPALERDHGEVALLGRPALDRHERGLLVAQLLDHLVDLGVVRLVDLRA